MAKKENNELANRNQAFLIYQDDNGIARVNVRFEGEDVWLTQEQMMELFDASQQDVSYHIGQIYEDTKVLSLKFKISQSSSYRTPAAEHQSRVVRL